MGYRRIEPAFCRGCGTPWSPGANTCRQCGEALTAAGVQGADPHAVPFATRAMGLAVALVGLRWLTVWMVWPDTLEPLLLVRGSWVAWGAFVLPAALVVATAHLWLRPRTPRADMRGWMWGVAALLGLLGGATAWLPHDDLVGLLRGFEPAIAWTLGLGLAGFGAALVLAALDEMVARGVLQGALEPLAGSANAAVATSVFSLCTSISPASLVSIGAASWIRARTGRVGPALAVRVLSTAVWWVALSRLLAS